MIKFLQDWKSEISGCRRAGDGLARHSKQNEAERAAGDGLSGRLEERDRLHAEGSITPPARSKYVEYDFFKRWMLRRIAEKEGGPVDTWRDHELTDWVALEGFVRTFLAQAGSVGLSDPRPKPSIRPQ